MFIKENVDQPIVRNYLGRIVRNLPYKTKKLLKEMANHTCEQCHKKSDHLEIDHIVPMREGGSDEIDNLQVLCYECHKIKTSFELRRWNNLNQCVVIVDGRPNG